MVEKSNSALENHSGVPKIIHQTWKTKKLTGDLKEWSSTWRISGYDYYLYNDNDAYKFVYLNHPNEVDLYESVSQIEKADIFRYLILYTYGGIYADIDTQRLRPIDDLLCMGNLVVGIEYNKPLQYLQWFIVAAPKNKVFLDLVTEIRRRQWFKWMIRIVYGYNYSVYWSSGPKVFTDIVMNNESIVVLEKGLLGSYPGNNSDNNSYLIHHFKGSWKL
jgi:mannosyltransferase OCH1-like enzyme